MKIIILTFPVLLLIYGCKSESTVTPKPVAKDRLENLYNQKVSSSDVQFAETILAEIDQISMSSMSDEQKKILIKEQVEKLDASWWTNGKYEKALLLINMSNQVESRDAWVVCITRAKNRGDDRCVESLKEILKTNSTLDEKQRYFLYDGISTIGGTNELTFLREEYPKVKSYDERFLIAATLCDFGDKTGVPTLIEAYERRSDSPAVQDWVIQKLRNLYGKDYGDNIDEWKMHVLTNTNATPK